MKIRSLFILLLLSVCFSSCKKDPTGPSGPGEPAVDLTKARLDIAINISDNFIIPGFAQLATSADQLTNALSTFSDTPSMEHFESLKNELKQLRIDWQKVSMFNMGPSLNNTLTGVVNTYPSDISKIEANILSGNYTIGSIDNKVAEGFQAVSYLLNGEDAFNKMLNSPERVAYMQNLIDQIHTTIQTVNSDWESDSYLDNFVSNTQNGTDVGSAIGILVNVVDLYLQTRFRDGKVAIPAGVRSAGIPRPLATEAFYAGYDKTLFLAALDQLEAVLKGEGYNNQEGESLLSYLEKIDQESLKESISSQLNIIRTTANDLNETFAIQIEEDNEQMINLFLAMQELVGLIKTDLATMIGIKITNMDIDGD